MNPRRRRAVYAARRTGIARQLPARRGRADRDFVLLMRLAGPCRHSATCTTSTAAVGLRAVGTRHWGHAERGQRRCPCTVSLDRADAPWYVACVQDAEIQRFTTDAAELTVAQVEAAISAADCDAGREASVIRRADDGARLGNLALDYESGCAHLSYWVAREARGAGVASGAIGLLCSWLAAQGECAVAALWCHVDNVASQRAAERAGFLRHPAGDRERVVKGSVWPTLAYRRALCGLAGCDRAEDHAAEPQTQARGGRCLRREHHVPRHARACWWRSRAVRLNDRNADLVAIGRQAAHVARCDTRSPASGG